METALNPQSLILSNLISCAVLGLSLLQFWIWGMSYGMLARRLIPSLKERLPDLQTITSETLTGLLLFGLIFFCLSWLIGSVQITALLLTGATLALGLTLYRLSHDRTTLSRLTTMFQSLDTRERWIFSLILLLILLNFSRTMILQNHGDQYLYHLAIGRIWTEAGRPIVTVANITSGYSWSVEAVYTYFRQIVGGDSTLILVAQQCHAVVSMLGGVILSYALIRPHLSRTWTLSLLVIFLGPHPHLNQMAFYAKNDGIAFLLAFFALYFSLTRRWTDLLLISPFFLGSKITTALALAAIGVVSILREWIEKESRSIKQVISIWVIAGFLSLVGITPYLLANAMQTGNPLFPLLNNVFQSPLAPQTAQSLVGEMDPLGLTFSGYWSGALAFIQEHYAVLLLYPVAIFAHVRAQSKSPGPSRTHAFTLIATAVLGFTVLQLGLNQYGHRIEARHFKIVQFCLPLGLICLASTVTQVRLRKFILLGLVIGGVSVTHLDVLVRDFIRLRTVENLKEHYFSRRPFNRIFEYISAKPEYCDTCHVLAVGKFIEGFFLKKGTLLMPNIHGELFIAKDESDQAFTKALDTMHANKGPILFGIIEHGYEDIVEAQWIRKNLHPAGKHENYLVFSHIERPGQTLDSEFIPMLSED